MAGTNTLIYGPVRLAGLSLAGKTVSDVRGEYGNAIGAPAGATATINGIAVRDSQTITNGEEIVFTKVLGQKG